MSIYNLFTHGFLFSVNGGLRTLIWGYPELTHDTGCI